MTKEIKEFSSMTSPIVLVLAFHSRASMNIHTKDTFTICFTMENTSTSTDVER